MKKVYLFATLLLLLCSTMANAHDFEMDGIYFSILQNDIVGVSCKGTDANEFTNEYRGDIIIPEVVIYNGITYCVKEIEWHAFNGCTELTSIVIPNSVTYIGVEAFAGCTGLKEISIGDGVEFVESGAFRDCTGLKAVNISNLKAWCKIPWIFDGGLPGTQDGAPNPLWYAGNLYLNGELLTDLIIPAVETIAPGAFMGCTSIKSVTIPDTLIEIGAGAFVGCKNIEAVYIRNLYNWCKINFDTGPSGLISGSNPLYYAGNLYIIKGITIPETRELLTHVVTPDSIFTIKNYTFDGCTSIKEVTLSNYVENVSNYAFRGCTGLTSIKLGPNVKIIDGGAFSNCTGIEEIAVSEDNTVYDSRENCNAIINSENNYLVLGCVNSVIPNSVTMIGSLAFKGVALTSIVIPNSVTYIGVEAFAGCSNLVRINIPESVTRIGHRAFANCTSLVNVTIPSNVTTLGGWAFGNCTAMKSITSLIPTCNLSLDKEFDSAYEYESFISGGYETAFYGIDKYACTIYVPNGTKETYSKTLPWSEFANIIELDNTTGFDEVITENETRKAVYDINGRCVENPTKGIHLINGKKVLIK